MARKDISIDLVSGDAIMTDNLVGKKIYPFRLIGSIEGIDNDQYIYGEIEVSMDFERRYNDSSGIHVNIPYIPTKKRLAVRFKIESLSDSYDYVINKTNNKIWFNVISPIEEETLYASQFIKYNTNFNYNLIMRGGDLKLYSGSESDLIINAAVDQNKTFLFKCFPANVYRYPSTGIGLAKYLNSIIEKTDLADKISKEFNDDKVTVKNASIDTVTNEIYIEIQEQNG